MEEEQKPIVGNWISCAYFIEILSLHCTTKNNENVQRSPPLKKPPRHNANKGLAWRFSLACLLFVVVVDEDAEGQLSALMTTVNHIRDVNHEK